jgi:hypothetical protein
MSTTVRDASLITKRNRDVALYAFNRARVVALNAGTTVQPEQPTYQSHVIVTERNIGCGACATGQTVAPNGTSVQINYPFVGSGGGGPTGGAFPG